MSTLPERFWNKVTKTETCWLWTGSICGGYGRFGVRLESGRMGGKLAHRVAYEALVGPIPDGLTLDHLCYVRNCVNPSHLEPVTRAENTQRAAARLTHCPNGHAYSAETRVPDYKGRLRCLICRRIKNAEYMRRRRATTGSVA